MAALAGDLSLKKYLLDHMNGLQDRFYQFEASHWHLRRTIDSSLSNFLDFLLYSMEPAINELTIRFQILVAFVFTINVA